MWVTEKKWQQEMEGENWFPAALQYNYCTKKI